MFPFIVADIGGTHARFGLVAGKNLAGGEYQFNEQKALICADFMTFDNAMEVYFASSKDISPRHFCIVVAAPEEGDNI